MTKAVGRRLQNENGLLGNFGTDAVARENGKFQKHAGISLMETQPRSGGRMQRTASPELVEGA
jgi:hypothetical protein